MRPFSGGGFFLWSNVPSLVPSEQVLRRHYAAMTVVKELSPEDRVLLLGYVVGGTERILELEAGDDREGAEDQVGQPA